MPDSDGTLNAIARIVAAIVATHGTEIADLPAVVSRVREALEGDGGLAELRIALRAIDILQPEALEEEPAARASPRKAPEVPTGRASASDLPTPDASILPDRLLCLECGEAVIMLKFHLRHSHKTTFAAYREKFGLPDTYPTIPPTARERMRRQAAEQGLGQGLKTRWPERRKAARKALQATQQKAEDPTPGYSLAAVVKRLPLPSQHSPEVREPYNPAVDPRASVFPERLVCLSCGQQFRTITKHLKAKHKLSFQAYKDKWSLPNNYPSIAPNLAEKARQHAKDIGLGHGTRSRWAQRREAANREQ